MDEIGKDMFYIKSGHAIIYGAGSNGKVYQDLFEKNGIRVIAYIDKRAQALGEAFGKPVIGLQDLPKIENSETCFVFVSIRNVFEHEDIANECYKNGISNIIYKPLSVLNGEGDADDTIDRAYESITAEKLVPEYAIDCFSIKKQKVRDYSVIKRESDTVLALLPSELLFSNFINRAEQIRWDRRNFLFDYPAVYLYEALGNNEEIEANIRCYIDEFAKPGALSHGVDVSGEWESILVKSRYDVFLQMKEKLLFDPYFFWRNPTKVAIDDEGRLILVKSGKNRVSFMMSQKYRFIPVEISRADYERFFDFSNAKRVFDYIVNQKKAKLFAPIAHPFFLKACYTEKNYLYSTVRPIVKQLQTLLSDKRYKAIKKIRVVVNDEGFLSRYLMSVGFETDRFMTENEDICTEIDSLFPMMPYRNTSIQSESAILIYHENIKSDIQQFLAKEIKAIIYLGTRKATKVEKYDFCTEFMQTLTADGYLHGYIYRKEEI